MAIVHSTPIYLEHFYSKSQKIYQLLREGNAHCGYFLLIIQRNYNARLLASDIKTYFEENPAQSEKPS